MQDTNDLDKVTEKSLEDLKRQVTVTARSLEKVSRIIDNIEKENKRELYKSMPGVSGYFDGVYLIGEDGSKHEVPANYAAKSRLVYGDVLKMLNEDGKIVFKQIEKVDRKKLEGVLSKKEGKWYFLSDGGTYKISDVAAEFHKAELNDKAVAYVPEKDMHATYAALDYLEKEKVEKDKAEIVLSKKDTPVLPVQKIEVAKASEITLDRPPAKNIQNLPPKQEKSKPKFEPRKPAPKKNRAPKQEISRPQAPVSAPEKEKDKKEFVANIVEEDDLR